jgi:hypothetical protein
MLNLFNKDKKYPPFETLQGFAHKDNYFVRTAQWRRLNKQMITVTDPRGPRMLTMDQWPQIAFLESDGQRTVTEFVHYLAGAYIGPVPANLDQTVVGELEKLVGYGIIAFRDQKGRPESVFDQPVG